VCGVPRSPNRYLDEFRVLGQVDFGRRKIEPDRFLYNSARFRFSFAG
jgi:hypothetical protein